MATATGRAFTYDANGSLVSSAVGNATTTYAYDAANRLVSISGASGNETSAYAPDGRRSRVTSPAVEGTIQPEYDLAGNPILDMDLEGSRVWIYRVYGPAVDEVLGEKRTSNGRATYPLRDALGSVTAMTATDGRVLAHYSHRAFGAETRTDKESVASPPSRLAYTGRERSVGTLMQYRSRYYDTSVGRFTQQDSYRGSELAPPSLHRYTYVYNNPALYTDPTGHMPWLHAIAAAAIAYVAFVVVAAILATLLRVGELCGTDDDCVTAVIDGAFSNWQVIPIVGFMVTVIGIFTDPDLVNPLQGMMWVIFSAMYAWFMVEWVIVPELSKIMNPYMRGAAIIGAIAAAQYMWSKFMKWGIRRG